MSKKTLIMISFVSLALCGCASTGVIDLGDGVYMIADTSKTTWTGAEVLKGIIAEAREFCAKQGKEFHTLDINTRDKSAGGIFGGGLVGAQMRKAGAELKFTCK